MSQKQNNFILRAGPGEADCQVYCKQLQIELTMILVLLLFFSEQWSYGLNLRSLGPFRKILKLSIVCSTSKQLLLKP